MPKKRQNLLFSLLNTISPDSILPLQSFLKDVTAKYFGTFPFTYEVSLSSSNGDKRENILHLWIRNCFILFLERTQKYTNIFFNESAIYLGYITTKLSIPKGCIKERHWFSEKFCDPFRGGGGIKKGIQSHSRNLTKSEN